jgi:rubrerythrin
MEEKTREHLYEAFVGEAKAHRRLLAYAERAEEDGFPEVASLFRAVSYAEGVHADNALRLLGEVVVKDTQENLEDSFEREETASQVTYTQFIRDAEAEGERRAAIVFSQARDAEEAHASLYKRAISCMLREEPCEYHVCDVCGLVVEGTPPEECPICGAKRERFVFIE